MEIECDECGHTEEVDLEEVGPTADLFGFMWTCPKCGNEKLIVPED
jgi:predicted nucleic-acid-binding Zn-ribbon protein